jgi:hypothetical protein
MGILIRQTATRFENSHRVFTHSFDSTTGWQSSDNSTREIEWESQRLHVPPPKTPIRGRQRDLLTKGTRRRRRPGPTRTLVAAVLSTFVGLTAVTLVLGVHPALDKVTLQKDAAELVSLETQSRQETSPPADQSPPSLMANNARVRSSQTRRELALTQQPYEQKGPSSLLAGISRALGFSRN